MQNFDDFENFSSNQNLKEVFQHVFELGKGVGPDGAVGEEIHSAAAKPGWREIKDYDEKDAAAAKASAGESAQTMQVNASGEPAQTPASAPGEPVQTTARGPKTEAPSESEIGAESVFRETPDVVEKPIEVRVREQAPEVRAAEPAPRKEPEPEPVRESSPARPAPGGNEVRRAEPRQFDCKCPLSERELKEFYFRVQELYFVLEHCIDNGYDKELMRELRELCVRVLRLVKRKYCECFDGPLSAHCDEGRGDLRWAARRLNELLCDSLDYVERCGENADLDMLLIFLTLQTIAHQLPMR